LDVAARTVDVALPRATKSQPNQGGSAVRTQVGIVGAGPAGLLLSQLLRISGIESVVLDSRPREAIEATIRAGVLEQGTVKLLTDTGVGARLHREGFVHHGFELRFGGRGHRIDLHGLTGHGIVVYPQHEVLKDLIRVLLDAGGDLRFAVRDTAVHDITGERPRITFIDADGAARTLECDYLAGCDGFHGICRPAIPATARDDYQRVYPFGWFGILAEAPPSADELIYARHERGFALISTRSPSVQRMYFQCPPDERADDWSEEAIWAELQARVAGDGFRLHEGRILRRGVIAMRSFVCEPLRHGRLFLAGDAAHVVPPTGAKGLNLAAADIFVLARAFTDYYATGRTDLLDGYSATALRRVWRAQHFSWWMTSMLHRIDGASDFDQRRQLAELDLVTATPHGAKYLAENYVGLPFG
jgi:p-hydroxybenzoate 3-monooxygenase